MNAHSTKSILQMSAIGSRATVYRRQLLRLFDNDKVTSGRFFQRPLHTKCSATSSKFDISKLFGRYLMITNTISTGILMTLGDIVTQEIEYRQTGKHRDRFDSGRSWRMFLAGCLQGPMNHYGYHWMDVIMPERNMRNAVRKILLDQVVMSPVCLAILFYSIDFMEGKSFRDSTAELIDKFPYIYMMDCLVWPGAQYFNFRYLHNKYRVMFVNVCTAFYNIFLSYMKYDFHEKQE